MAVVASAIVLGTALPASAIQGYCSGSSHFQYEYTSSGGSTSDSSGACGTMGVQVHYVWPGGNAWTTYVYGDVHAIRNAANVVGSHHTTSVGSQYRSLGYY
jgi:hypothetical protein